MSKIDPTAQFRAIDVLLESVDNPLHRRILLNYRRHAILEITHQKELILLDPEMTVPHPRYMLNVNDTSVILDGAEEILAWYGSLEAADATVMLFEDERISVFDEGFYSEGWMNTFLRGSLLPEDVHADPDGYYVLRQYLAMHWPYNSQGLLEGEHAFEHKAAREIIQVSADDFITIDQARAALLPILNEVPPAIHQRGDRADASQ